MIMIRLYDTNDNDQGEEGAVVLANAFAQLVHQVGQNSFSFFEIMKKVLKSSLVSCPAR